LALTSSRTKRTVLKSVSDEIRDCYKQAEACARQAAAQTDGSLQNDFRALEAAWLKLARLRERDLSDQIRERAYEMWIASGRDGEAEQHWLTAEREILSSLQSPNSSTETREAEAEILEAATIITAAKSGGI
jgi:DUF2934 family protein